MKKALFAMAFAALFAVGCQISDFAPDMKKELKVFTGTIADDATRAALLADGDIYHVTWSLNDRIMINDEYEFTATVGDATTTYFVQDTTGARPDDPPTGPYKAVYPFSVGRGMPGVQNYVAGGVEIIPMYAESDNENLSFKNMVGILKLNVKTGETGVVVKKIVMTADQPMSGEYEVVNNAAVVSGTAGVTVNCGEGVAIGADPVPFFVTVPANTYTGMTIKVYTTDGKVASVKMKSGASVTVERSKYYEADFSFNGFTPIEGVGGVALLPSGPDFNTIIKQTVLEDDLATNTTIDEKNVTRIVFNTLCTDTEGIEIQDLSSDKPIYFVYDKTSGVVSINTPAETIKTQADASYLFATFGSLKYIDNLKCLNTEDAELMNHMFFYLGCTNRELRAIDLSNFNTSNATTMRSMFNACRNITSLDLSSFDTKNVETMAYMFQYCINLKQLDLSNFNTENCEDLKYMFAYCYALENVNVSSFNTENCTDLSYMFSRCNSVTSLDLTSFNTENSTNFSNIFSHCYKLVDIKIPNFNIESSIDIRSFFNRCDDLQVVDVSMLDGTHITSTTYCGYFFYRCHSLREIFCGDTFMFGCLSNYLFCGAADPFDYRPATMTGNSLTIHCDQDIADWWARTALRWMPVGYSGKVGGEPTYNYQPITVTFLHWKTGNELQVEWSAP